MILRLKMGLLISDFVVKEVVIQKKPYYHIDMFFTQELIDNLGCSRDIKIVDEKDFFKLYNHFVLQEEGLFMNGFNFKSCSTPITPDIKLKLFRTHTINLTKERIPSEEELKENSSVEKIAVRFDEESYERAKLLKEIEINEAVESFKFALHEHYGLDDNKHNLEITHKAFEIAKLWENDIDNINQFMSYAYLAKIEKIYVTLLDLKIENKF